MSDKERCNVTYNFSWWVPWMGGYLFFLGAGGEEMIEGIAELIVGYFFWPFLLGQIIFP